LQYLRAEATIIECSPRDSSLTPETTSIALQPHDVRRKDNARILWAQAATGTPCSKLEFSRMPIQPTSHSHYRNLHGCTPPREPFAVFHQQTYTKFVVQGLRVTAKLQISFTSEGSQTDCLPKLLYLPLCLCGGSAAICRTMQLRYRYANVNVRSMISMFDLAR
jgi:hypothetical protein